MDNITHSLAGLVLAEAAVQLRGGVTGAEPSRRFRTFAAVSSMIAANLPDSDLLYTGVGGDRLAYMLHHRGYTHTVVIAGIGAVLLWGAVTLAWRWRTQPALPRGDSRWFFGLLLVSAMSHLVLDWTNSYGVHPWWPFDDRWMYGDTVFIVEPSFWVLTVPLLFAASTSRVARVLLALVLLAGLGLAWGVDLVSRGSAIALTCGAVLSIVLVRAVGSGVRVATAIAGWVVVTLVLAAGSAAARETAIRAVQAADPAAEVLDVVVSPLPANAVCMAVITVERSGDAYRIATARVSSVPSITAASKCGARERGGGVVQSSARQSIAALHWDAEWTAPHAELATLARESCPALAALRFYRVPTWRALDDSTVMMGDARFGGGSGSGFSDVRVPRRARICPANVPPWIPPRAELLGFQAGRLQQRISR